MSQVVQFNFPTVIRFGVGAIKELSSHLKDQGKQRPLLVTDPIVATLPFFLEIVDDLKKAGLQPSVYSEMHKNPVKSDVLNGKSAFNEANSDCIVGVGGGVGLDVARAIALAINHHRDLFDYDDLIGGDKYVTNAVPYFVTVPTTSGTGSEVGRSAIIADDETHQKKILFSPKLLASMVFADPALTFGLPPFVTAATGMDALTHNMEAYVAKNYHPMCDGIALEGIKLVGKSLEKATNEGDNVEARSNMMLASLMGAVAFQKGLGVVHSLAHPMSQLLDTHHGLANAVNLPYGMKFNLEGFESRFEDMANALGLKGGNGIQLIDELFKLNERLGLPTTLSAIDVKEAHLEPLADLAFADFCHPNNPKPVTREDFLSLYKKAL
ncbi:MAG: iron-containing alcohol dehydrogenase [Flavobacteriales bacterium]|nr:iron-containing alcohol dehydrogenase [Flavobacteriales bacterium]MCB9187504.1 iron-containing alcohol dehydrogenase [Flavobacteriales bacterium]MCB9190671.1 iron-containing alcohol dehydrogenase [Flavobacteriales bacterium]